MVEALFPSLQTDIPLWSPVLDLAVSMGVGISFGADLAFRASRLEPIESLRYEETADRVKRAWPGLFPRGLTANLR